MRISTPGSRPASHSTWKPLQMPSTGVPALALATTSRMIGRVGGHGAGAQIVAVGEAARQHDQVAGRHVGIAVPDHADRAARHLLERDLHVAIAVGARERR